MALQRWRVFGDGRLKDCRRSENVWNYRLLSPVHIGKWIFGEDMTSEGIDCVILKDMAGVKNTTFNPPPPPQLYSLYIVSYSFYFSFEMSKLQHTWNQPLQ